MSLLPQDTELGAIALVEVYVYYDRPCLFSCRSEKGDLFLALWIDETLESDRWLYAPIPESVIEQLGSGNSDIRSFFTDAPGDRVFDIEVFEGDRPSVFSCKSCCDLTDDILPV